MPSGTQVRRVLLQINTDDGDSEEKLDRISAKADELKEKHPELAVRIDTAAANAKLAVLRAELKDVGKDVPKIEPKLDEAKAAEVVAESKALGDTAGQSAGGGFLSGFSGTGTLWTTGIVAALGALPAIAAAGGAAAGIALGAALLIGTKKVQGPLYSQFQDLMKTLTSVLRVAALPLVKPLGDAFAQIGRWAKDMYPVLHQIFASLGPLVAPFAKGLEGLVSGVLPGFLHLMQAARPAVAAVAGVLSTLGSQLGSTFQALIPGIKSSAQFLTGVMTAISSLLPFVARLANVVASLLGPIMAQLGGKLLPQLVNALDNTLTALTPLLPPIGQLVAIILQFNVGPMVGGLNTIGNVLVRLEGPIQTVANMLQGLANLASGVLSLLSRIPGAGGMFSGAGALAPGAGIGGIAGLVGGAADPFAGSSAFDSAAAAAGEAYGSNWADGVTSGMVAGASKTAKAKAAAKAKKAAPQITAALAQGLVQALQGTQSQIGHATLSILKVIWGDEAAGILTRGEASALAAWVKQDNARLQALAVHRNAIAKEIAAARQYAAGITSSTESTFGLVNSAAGGPNGFLPEANIIAQLQEEVRRTRSFAADIKKLKKMGLNKAYLAQLLQAGPVQGGPIADELANGPLSEIGQINAAEAQIASASVGLGQLGANILYDRGKGAGKGFLSGLEQQEKQTEAAMRKLAQALVAGARRELKVEFVGGHGADREFWTFLKRQIRIHGGNPAVLGR